MIQIYLLTGFLGAGKTTLLQSLLKSYQDEKIGVIVNEFGEINIDARLVRREGMQMAELSNGSIFCACIKDKFVDSLIEMSGRDIDRLLIEASGLADPANMGQILEGIKHKTVQQYGLAGAICVVDAVHFPGLVEILPALENQVAYANAVIVNKADLADSETLAAAEAKIHEINPQVNIFVTSYCQVELKEIAQGLVPVQKVGSDTTNTIETRPSAFVLKSSEALSYEGLAAFLKAIAPACYRIKGFVRTDRGGFEVSAVREDIQVNPWTEPIEKTELAAISSVGIKLLSIIVSASREHLDSQLKL